MLKINPNPTFTESVDITVPGQKLPGTVSLTFKYKTKDEVAAFWKEHKDKPWADVVGEIVIGWDGFDVEYNAENLKAFLGNYSNAGFEIVMAWQKLLFESRVKN